MKALKKLRECTRRLYGIFEGKYEDVGGGEFLKFLGGYSSYTFAVGLLGGSILAYLSLEKGYTFPLLKDLAYTMLEQAKLYAHDLRGSDINVVAGVCAASLRMGLTSLLGSLTARLGDRVGKKFKKLQNAVASGTATTTLSRCLFPQFCEASYKLLGYAEPGLIASMLLEASGQSLSRPSYVLKLAMAGRRYGEKSGLKSLAIGRKYSQLFAGIGWVLGPFLYLLCGNLAFPLAGGIGLTGSVVVSRVKDFGRGAKVKNDAR